MKTQRKFSVLLMCVLLSAKSFFAQNPIIQGLRVPSLTTEQRDQLPTDYLQANGLMIFNRDINCQEYWNGKAWISLCGSVSAEMDISKDMCNKIRAFGRYFAGVSLDYTHYITLPVTVTELGAYTISAKSYNGYFFHTSGVFEELGDFELTLTGMGTPRNEGIDKLTITSNGEEIGTLCSTGIEVLQLGMAYRVDCHRIEVMGEYRANRPLSEDNFVIIPVEVMSVGTTTIRTSQQNGLRFSGTKTFTDVGYDEIILYADGTAVQEGAFVFEFSSDGDIRAVCQFMVNCVSSLGTFEDPACNCLEIFLERPFAPNGEYWLQDCKSFAESDDDDDASVAVIRTYCDIVGGGWTLVWSYSENTARNVYVQNSSSGGTGNQNSMRVSPAYWHFTMDRPRPIDAVYDTECDDPQVYQINYSDFRLPLQAWEFLSDDPDAQHMKVRITENPTDMRDSWALNNFAIMTAHNRGQNPYLNTWTTSYVPTAGRVFGKRWEVRTSDGWDEMSGNRRIRMRNSNSNAFGGAIWQWENRGSTTYFEVRPNRGGDVNTTRLSDFDYSFGNFNSTMPNHHFGKCVNGSGVGDDFSFDIRTCSPANLVPHSFNNGEGRYLQWYVR